MSKKLNINRTSLIHILCWGLIIAFPLFMYRQGDTMSDAMRHYLRSLGASMGYMAIFYFNYTYTIPRLLFENKRKRFVLYNIIAIFVTVAAMTWWWHWMGNLFPSTETAPPRFNAPPRWTRFVQMSLMLILVVGLSVAIRMSQRWQKLQEAKKEAERTRTEAELKNLRNQLNPHFLLNTLNNIYALTAFDTAKAQEAIQELSKMMRHILYDYQKPMIPLKEEIEFLENYVKLMRIRLPESVEVLFNAQKPTGSIEVAPMILISLIENAFKHGISPTEKSFVHINISTDGTQLVCAIENSNNPKTSSDYSGHGIGLQQVQRRLDLAYPNRYTWEQGTKDENKTYYSIITIQL